MSGIEVKLERAACHEAGHIVVAARLGLRLRPEGLNVDPVGEGLACYHKDPDDSDCSKERVIVASFAGFKAETRLCEKRGYIIPDPLGVIDSLDWREARIVECTLSNTYLANEGVPGVHARLEKRSKDIVAENWATIEMLATSLLAEPWVKRERLLSGNEWSNESVVKRLSGERLVAMLTQAGINASL